MGNTVNCEAAITMEPTARGDETPASRRSATKVVGRQVEGSPTSGRGAEDHTAPAARKADDSHENLACPICLEQLSSANEMRVLECGHKFCVACVVAYLQSRGGNGPDSHSARHPCPCCRQLVNMRQWYRNSKVLTPREGPGAHWYSSDNTRPGSALRSMQNRPRPVAPAGSGRRLDITALHVPPGIPQARLPPVSSTARAEAVRELRRAAGRSTIKFCPSCQSPVVKNGGCNQMRCLCGFTFRWDQARPLRPCLHCHRDWDDGPIRQFKTCSHCSAMAQAEKHVLRTVSAVAAAPAAAVAAGIVLSGVAAAVVSIAIPAAIAGPLALLYEPVRRIRKKKMNPLAYVAAAGFVPVVLCCQACGYESD